MPLNYSPFDLSILENPYPTYKALRDHGPVYHNKEYDFYVLPRHKEVKQAALDTKSFSSAQGISLILDSNGKLADEFVPEPRSMITMDPPEHSSYRALVRKAFSSKQITRLQQLIHSVSAELIDDLDTSHQFDFANRYANLLPTTVICDLLGCQKEHRAIFKAAADGIVDNIQNRDAALKAMIPLMSLLWQQIEQRKQQPGDDLITALLNESFQGRSLSQMEIMGFVSLLMIAGTETTANLLSSSLYYMEKNPDVKELLFSNSKYIDAAIEEFLRLESPAQALARTTTCDVEIEGFVIPKGKKVLLLWASANRDESVFPRADEFDLSRNHKEHIAFGYGVHLCLGSHLARLEAKVSLTDLLTRHDDFTVNTNQAVRTPNMILRGFKSLPLKLIAKSTTQSAADLNQATNDELNSDKRSA